jgi:hypothetical protein
VKEASKMANEEKKQKCLGKDSTTGVEEAK